MYSQKYRLQMLLQRQDRVGMKNSVEIRVPFLSPDLLTFVNSLPLSHKYNDEQKETKFILKKTVKGLMPSKIINSKKVGFPSDMMSWINDNRMKLIITNLINEKNSFCQNYLDGFVVKKALNLHYEGKYNLSTLIWMLYSLELWHKKYF